VPLFRETQNGRGLELAWSLLLGAGGLLAVSGLMNPSPSLAQSATTAARKFEVTSIKPCNAYVPPGGRGAGGAGGGDRVSPGRMTLACSNVRGLIEAAYVVFADGRTRRLGREVPIQGGPSWIDSERYEVVAKAEDNASPEMMMGPLLQALLEDRFKLIIRHVQQEASVYELTVAKGGLKLPRFKEGSCRPYSSIDRTKFPERIPALPKGESYCESLAGPKGANIAIDSEGTTLEEFSRLFLSTLDRPVVDRTGVSGKFDIHLEFAPGEGGRRLGGQTQSDAGEATAPEIFTALQEQLGLRLMAAKAPVDVLAIDRVERPSEN